MSGTDGGNTQMTGSDAKVTGASWKKGAKAKAKEQLEQENKIAKVQAMLRIVNFTDRFFATPLDDCVREKRDDCHHLLKSWIDNLEAELKTLEEENAARKLGGATRIAGTDFSDASALSTS